jgi:hypothetical protein
MSEQAFWYDGGPRDPDFLDVAGSDLGLADDEDEDDEDDLDDLDDLLR